MSRAKPYQRAGDSDGAWKHDLFGPGSSVYNPVVSRKSAAAATPSASLRPFGNATPSTVVEEAPKRAPKEPAARKQRDLLSRIEGGTRTIISSSNGVGTKSKGSNKLADRLSGASTTSGNPLFARLGLASPAASTSSASAGLGPQRTKSKPRPTAPRSKSDSHIKKPAKVFDGDLSMDLGEDDVQVIEPPPQPASISIKSRAEPAVTPVRIQGLVADVTEDDVRRAFEDEETGGEIVECSVKPMQHMNASGQLEHSTSAYIVFKLRADAERAVDKFHGKMADGSRLSVVIQEPSKPPAAPREQRYAGGFIAPTSGAFASGPAAGPSRIEEPSRMRADEVAALDPRAHSQVQPDYYRTERRDERREPRSNEHHRYADGGRRDEPRQRPQGGREDRRRRASPPHRPSSAGDLLSRIS